MLQYDRKGNLCETEYKLTDEPKHAALFTTGNGYLGIRGSFEEFGSSRIQGAYVRGFIDEIVEVLEPFPDNEYMKKYYFDEQALKEFEKQDSCINFADILLVRFSVGGETFFPWEGKILSWKRFLDPRRGVLTREVRWESAGGKVTEFRFERFASYADEHLYVMKCTATPVNHRELIQVISGIDPVVRTGGQKILSGLEEKADGTELFYRLKAGPKYGFIGEIGVHSEFLGRQSEPLRTDRENGILALRATFEGGETAGLVKTIWVQTSRDPDYRCGQSLEKVRQFRGTTFETLEAAHLAVWQPLLKRFDIRIEGDADADASLRFSTYHTVISADRSDSVHSLSAKTLSGERYNQFVWWDAEIYQQPAFRFADPSVIRLNLDYRYRQLPDARARAKQEGLQGARFPFVSSVDGTEKVWKYARHPHLQVHITADVGISAIEYYHHTGDLDYLRQQGYELLADIMRYWVSRSTLRSGRYEILNVTGTDEHHPYVDNDAYTNYLVHRVFAEGLPLFEQDPSAGGKYLSEAEAEQFRHYAETLYLPLEENGLIPQFDGYFSLSRTLRTEGGGTGKSFQMKQAGLYHESQIIKQPDVMLLFSYLNCAPAGADAAANWDYYEAMCESSSSLSYPPHAICSADQGRMYSFLKYFFKTVRVDIDDVFGCAWQGIHGGCAAGGYYAVLRGLFGITVDAEGISFRPNAMPFWKKVTLPLCYRGRQLRCVMKDEQVTVVLESGEPLDLRVNGRQKRLNHRIRFRAAKGGRQG